MLIDLKKIRWQTIDGKEVNGYFVKTNRGWLRVIIKESEFYEELPEGHKIVDVNINFLGKITEERNESLY